LLKKKQGKKSNYVCASCASCVGVDEKPHQISEAPTLPFDQAKADFLRTDDIKSLNIDDVLALTETEAFNKFVELRFSSNGGKPECIKCGSQSLWFHEERRGWICKECRCHFSPTSETIFSSRKLTYKFYLSAIAMIVNGPKDRSLFEIANRLGVNYRTVFQLGNELRAVLANPGGEDPVDIKDLKPRFFDRGFHNTHTRWTNRDQEALIALVKASVDVEKAAEHLGRTPKNLASRARDLGILLPEGWRPPRPLRIAKPGEQKIVLNYPYIAKPRNEHAELMAA
jgi:transposase-like protein